MTDSDPKTRLPGWAKAAIVVAALAVVAVVVLHLWTGAATARWERYADALRSGGTPLTFDEIEALRTEIPDQQNGRRCRHTRVDALVNSTPGSTDSELALDSVVSANLCNQADWGSVVPWGRSPPG